MKIEFKKGKATNTTEKVKNYKKLNSPIHKMGDKVEPTKEQTKQILNHQKIKDRIREAYCLAHPSLGKTLTGTRPIIKFHHLHQGCRRCVDHGDCTVGRCSPQSR